MRINKHTNNTKRNLVVASVIVLLFIIGVAGWYYVSKSSTQETSENVVDYGPATDDQLSTGTKAKEDFNNTHYSKDDNVATENKSDVDVLISSMNQDGSTLTIATTIETVQGGTCELKMSRTGSETVSMQSPVIKITTYSACEDFNVNVMNLEKGEWNVQVKYLGSTATGVATGKVDIK